jgi:hypothetical protein
MMMKKKKKKKKEEEGRRRRRRRRRRDRPVKPLDVGSSPSGQESNRVNTGINLLISMSISTFFFVFSFPLLLFMLLSVSWAASPHQLIPWGIASAAEGFNPGPWHPKTVQVLLSLCLCMYICSLTSNFAPCKKYYVINIVLL